MIHTPLLYVIYRDGVLFYILIIAVKLFTIPNKFNTVDLERSASSSPLYYSTFDSLTFTWGVVGALATRMLLNIRGIRTEQDWADVTNMRSKGDDLSPSAGTHRQPFSRRLDHVLTATNIWNDKPHSTGMDSHRQRVSDLKSDDTLVIGWGSVAAGDADM